MRVGFVTVRYGASVVGGAEQACRAMATHLVRDAGFEVEVFTTCATEATTWADVTPEGTTMEEGVRVHRFRSASGRHPDFDAKSAGVLADPLRQPAAACERWLALQGPVCPALVEAAAGAALDVLVATPYMYWPTVEIVRRLPGRVVLHPAAHDEAPIRLPVFGSVFGEAAALVCYTEAERRLANRLFPGVCPKPQLVCGLGIDAPPAPDGPALDRPGAPDGPGALDRPDTLDRGRDFRRAYPALGYDPYALCLGRVDDGKGTAMLARFFATYRQRRPARRLKLVFAGPVTHRPPAHPDIVVTGPLSEERKWEALGGATVFVSPSAYESLSIVLLEAWAAGTPALVHRGCAATTEHARRSGGALAFGSYAEFEVAADRLLEDPGLRAALGHAGRTYVEDHFGWPAVVSRYANFLRTVAARLPGVF